MIEIECPACQARYQLPDGSIGSEGRNVSCSDCSHKWRAYSEGVAPQPSEPEPEAGTGERKDQMAAIRQMLTDIKEHTDAIPEPEPDSRPEPVAPTPTMRKRDEDDEVDPLKSRIDGISKLGAAEKIGYDANKLRRRHERRAKKFKRAREHRRKSGAFLTGFTLVAIVTATMVGLYVLHPQIIAASPGMKPALSEYVVTVDRFRVEIGEATAEWRTWLTERIAALVGDDN